MDQFFFMADRHDTNYCCVRYITNVRLREWKRYLQPLANSEYLLAARLQDSDPSRAQLCVQRHTGASHQGANASPVHLFTGVSVHLLLWYL